MNLRRDGLLRSARNDGILRPARLSPLVIPRCATAHLRMRHLAQARNPYSRSWLWIPGSRCARPGMTTEGIWHTHTPPHSRDAIRPSLCKFVRTLQIRGRREDRVHAAPAVSCANCTKKRTRAYRFSGGIPAFPAQWFYGLLRALPGDRAFLPPSSLRSVCFSKNLTPASGRQNHTTSPYANAPFVCALARAQHLRVHRIPPYVRDDHDTPLLVRRDGQACSDDLPDGERGMFLESGLDRANHVEFATENRAPAPG